MPFPDFPTQQIHPSNHLQNHLILLFPIFPYLNLPLSQSSLIIIIFRSPSLTQHPHFCSHSSDPPLPPPHHLPFPISHTTSSLFSTFIWSSAASSSVSHLKLWGSLPRKARDDETRRDEKEGRKEDTWPFSYPDSSMPACTHAATPNAPLMHGGEDSFRQMNLMWHYTSKHHPHWRNCKEISLMIQTESLLGKFCCLIE